MSDGLTSKQIDDIVLDVVINAGGIDAEAIARRVALKVYPFSAERRRKAVARSLQRLRKRGVMYLRPVWHFVSDY